MPSMPHPSPDRQADPDTEQIILGVDTHKDVHVAALITTLGVQLADATFPTTTAGYRQLLGWTRTFGVLRRAGVEPTRAALRPAGPTAAGLPRVRWPSVTTSAISEVTCVRLHPLQSRRDGDHRYVGRAEIGEFIDVPDVAVAALRLLD